MTPERSHRPEIQGLRAVAVGLVLLFHIWPETVPGGYVGVDVFFVISGFLITGLLARAAARGDLLLIDFYSRRVRRLMPAATLVLIVTFVGTLLFLPATRWFETTTQIAASALYIQNWVLAWQSVDYLAADSVASPVQHFWSLAIEEQFYLVWPLLMLMAIAASQRAGWQAHRIFFLTLAIVFVASLAASIWLTPEDPGQAYFVTHTRIWELALGGLLALSIHRINPGSALRFVMMAGLAAIIFSAFAYSAETAFPGYTALMPTLGTALVIIAGDVRLGRLPGLSTPLLAYIGDRSYSIYLWHWPIIVFYLVGRDGIGVMEGVGLIAISILAAHLTYSYVEEPFRHPKGRREVRPLIYGFASVGLCVVAAGAFQHVLSMGSGRDAPGAMALADPLYDWRTERLEVVTPSLWKVRDDVSQAYAARCFQNTPGTEVQACEYGVEGQGPTVVIVGDSHAVSWFPALEEMAGRGSAHVLGVAKSSCAFALQPVYSTRLRGPYEACAEWSQNVVEWLSDVRPDLVLVAQSSNHRLGPRHGDPRELANVFAEAHRAVLDLGIPLRPLRSTPWQATEPTECLSTERDWINACVTTRSDALRHDPIILAAQGLDIPFINTAQWFCTNDTCPPVIGGVIVYRDTNHFTATYARTLSMMLEAEITKTLSSLEAGLIRQKD
jgi:peptidoglycan/LPS O-acetylase OafA/YrhL